MTLLNIADMLSDILVLQDVYAGTIDGNLDKCIGVYNAKTSKPQRICIGGKACTKTLEKHISVLIHWTDTPTQAEIKAQSVLDILSDIRQHKADDFMVKYLECKEPVSVGRDERGVCEYVIEATVYYERNE